MTRAARRLLAAGLIWSAGGCVSTHYNLATQHQEMTITSTDKEVEMGRALARKVESALTVTPDTAMQERVRTIGERLVAVCDRQEIVYSFEVVDDPSVNAFSLPGGYIFVHTGLLKVTANDDELAAVLAHEIGHITARHAVKRYESGLGAMAAQAAAAVTSGGAGAGGVGLALQAAQLAYSREDELTSDRLAVKYMQAAGFNPAATLSFLKTLQKEHRKELHYLPRGIIRPQYALTHPFVPERIRAVKEALFGVADYVDYLNAPD